MNGNHKVKVKRLKNIQGHDKKETEKLLNKTLNN